VIMSGRIQLRETNYQHSHVTSHTTLMMTSLSNQEGPGSGVRAAEKEGD